MKISLPSLEIPKNAHFFRNTLQNQNRFWLHQYSWIGAAFASVLMMAYPLELAAQIFDLWDFNNYIVTPFGLITGLPWGLFAMPILHRQTETQTS